MDFSRALANCFINFLRVMVERLVGDMVQKLVLFGTNFWMIWSQPSSSPSFFTPSFYLLILSFFAFFSQPLLNSPLIISTTPSPYFSLQPVWYFFHQEPTLQPGARTPDDPAFPPWRNQLGATGGTPTITEADGGGALPPEYDGLFFESDYLDLKTLFLNS